MPARLLLNLALLLRLLRLLRLRLRLLLAAAIALAAALAALLQPDPDGLVVAAVARFHFEQASGRHQFRKLAVAIVARVEFRRLLGDVVAHAAQRQPAVLVGHGLRRALQQAHQARVLAQLAGAALARGRGGPIDPFGAFGVGLGAQHVGVDELVAGGDERLGRLALAEAVDGQPLLADARGQPGEVAVAGDDAEAVEAPGVQQVHGVDDHGAVGGVLAHGVAELLDRLDRVRQQSLLPSGQVGLGPVAVDALHGGHAVLGHFGQQAFHDGGRRVVGVDQHSQGRALARGICHVSIGGLRCSRRRPERAAAAAWMQRSVHAGGPPLREITGVAGPVYAA
ncbi:hypothetical protein D3C72_1097010 [compost metagenome]